MKANVRISIMLVVFALTLLTLPGCGKKDAAPDPSVKEQNAAADNKNEDSSSKGKEDAAMTQASNKKPMLTYLGHASIKIKTSDDVVVYIDPYAGTDYNESADILLVTHDHSDHNNVDKVKLKDDGKMITHKEALKGTEYQSFEIKGVKITGMPAYNQNHPKESSVGFLLEFDGIKLYHAGDTSKIMEMNQLLGQSITYALLPMDGVYNMGPEEASEAAKLIGAKYNIPIHTGPNGVFNEKNIAKFNVGNKIIIRPGDTIELKR